MKHFCLHCLSLSLLLASCQKASNNDESATVTLSPGCYIFTQNNSQILMRLEEAGNNFQGALVYDFYEKDNNTGSIEGSLSGDTLFAVYTFFSEGVESKREVAFLVREDSLIEGYGNSIEVNGIRRFEDPHRIDFSQGIVLSKTACN